MNNGKKENIEGNSVAVKRSRYCSDSIYLLGFARIMKNVNDFMCLAIAQHEKKIVNNITVRCGPVQTGVFNFQK